jgi:hypothetical protein
MNRITSLFCLAVLLLAALPVFAHDEVRVIGTVTKKQDSSIQVKTAAGKTFSIALNKETKISRDKKKADAAELKTGVSVVVDALGDSESDLVAQEVRIVPAITPSAAKPK